MEDTDVDTYITVFAELARKALYHEDDPKNPSTNRTLSHTLTHGTIFLVPSFTGPCGPYGARQDVHDPHATDDKRRRMTQRPVSPL